MHHRLKWLQEYLLQLHKAKMDIALDQLRHSKTLLLLSPSPLPPRKFANQRMSNKVSGLKPHNKTQEDVWAEMFYQRNQRHWWRWGRNGSIENWPMALDEKKTWLNMTTLDQCAGLHEVCRAIRKSKNNMDQIDKTNINDRSSSYVKLYFQLITSFLKDSHLCRIWYFCHA